MVKLTLKRTAVFIVALVCFVDLVKSQKDEKPEVRSLGHKRGVVAEQTVFVDRPYFVEQPVYYPYPYAYAYPYSYQYQYPYGVPGYPYNYSYTYTRTTSRPGGVVTQSPVGYAAPLPYAPLPPPYLRYLGNDTSIIRDEGVETSSLQLGNKTQVELIPQSNNSINEWSGQKDRAVSDRFPATTVSGLDEVDLAESANLNANPPHNETSPVDSADVIYYRNSSNLRVLARKGLLERVEEKVSDVFDGMKKRISGDDESKQVEKEDPRDGDTSHSSGNATSNHDKKTPNGGKIIKQVFNTIEDIVSNTFSG
ncbi:putative signal peptide protein [Cryptosporidium canis]|uniref:Signal peptide protein n=1 Tax=Cryptosporidium canis TaxID=195482 RepID=A0ABQ8P609_9CRYT|nr:putative signal peptide protein [Cryptosporidium canis]KAJ1609368.1 putative signal peptide protein [Cryptosporidium canis]